MHLGDDKREINVCRAGVVAGTLRDVAVDSCDMHKVCHCAAARASTGNKVAAEKRIRRGAQRMPAATTAAATAKYRYHCRYRQHHCYQCSCRYYCSDASYCSRNKQ